MVQTQLNVGGYEAWVVVEDEKIEHYAIDVDEEEKLATCWIASTAGKHFGVYVVKRHGKFNSVVDLYLDGSPMNSKVLRKDEMEPKLMKNVTVGEQSVRPFLFGALSLTEDETVLSSQMYEALGTIKIVFRRITNYKYHKRGPAPRMVQLQEDIKIHERAKKSATHKVLFGEVQKNPVKLRSGSITFKRKETLATFIFRYQSLDMLKALEIAPCDPPSKTESEPGPVPRKRKAALIEEEEKKPIVEIDDEEDNTKMVQLEDTLKSCLAELEKMRQARLDRQQGKHATKKVKRETKPVFLPGEIIDLTI